MSVCLQILPPSCIKSISFPLTPAQVLSNGLLNKGCAAVSPAYVYVLLALVKHSNEGGPGPRYNMKEDPGSSTLIMLKVHGCHLYLMPRFSEAGDNRNRWMGLPPHHSNQDRAPSHPLQVHTPPPAKVPVEASLGENTLRPRVQDQRPWDGQEEDEDTIVSFSAAELVTSAE